MSCVLIGFTDGKTTVWIGNNDALHENKENAVKFAEHKYHGTRAINAVRNKFKHLRHWELVWIPV